MLSAPLLASLTENLNLLIGHSVSLEGHYDARARVLVCHVTSLLQVPMEELDLLEEVFLESLKDAKEEESE